MLTLHLPRCPRKTVARLTDSPEIRPEWIVELTERGTCSGNPRTALFELSDAHVQTFHGNPNPAPNPNPDPSLLGTSVKLRPTICPLTCAIKKNGFPIPYGAKKNIA